MGNSILAFEVAGQRWWSICLEAFGAEANLEAYLQLTAEHVFEVPATPLLESKASFSYPAWLRSKVD